MIDGIKILYAGVDWQFFTNHQKLDFKGEVDLKTGVLAETVFAEFNGLKFSLSPSKENKGLVYLTIDGSLHKFWNDGNTNSDNFSIVDLKRTVQYLDDEFEIDAASAIIQNLEFGVNINLPIPAKDFIDNIISMPDKPFAPMNVRRLKIGKQCVRYEYSIKIYDKKLQEKEEKNQNLLRVEIKSKKARYLERFEIKTLADITHPEKLALLGEHLVDTFANMIYYDRSIDETLLSSFELIQLLRFCDSQKWSKLDSKKRYKKKIQFQNMMLKYGANKAKRTANILIVNTWSKLNDLIVTKQDVCEKSNEDEKKPARKKEGMFSQVVWGVKTSFLKKKRGVRGDGKGDIKREVVPLSDLLKDLLPEITPSKPKFCASCKADISHQKSRTKFCSKNRQCRDKAWNAKRKQRRRIFREVEERNLERILNQQNQVITKIEFSIFYKDGSLQKMVLTPPLPFSGMLQQVVKVEFVLAGDAVVLTTRRAKKLVKHLLHIQKSKL